MILDTGFDSVIESLYLKIPLTSSLRDATIIVNPSNKYQYVTGKTIIVTLDYSPGFDLNKLKSQNNIISRFSSEFIFEPYKVENCNSIKVNNLPSFLILNSTNLKSQKISICNLTGDIYLDRPIYILDTIINSYLTCLGFLAFQLGLITSEMYEAGISKDLSFVKYLKYY